MRKDVRDFIQWAGRIGFTNEGLTGHDHIRLRHRNGTLTIPNTPSDRRSLANSKAQARRIAGVKSDSPNAGHRRHVKGSGFDMHRKANEQAKSRHIETLRARLDLVHMHIAVLLERPREERNADLAHELIGALNDWDDIAAELQANFQPVPHRPVPLSLTETNGG